MADLTELEARIKRFEDLEAIKRMKHKYLRCLDSKLWDELARCFTEDATTSYSDGRFTFSGVNALVHFLKKGLDQNRITVHQGHHPEIDIVSDTAATGIWSLHEYVIDRQANTCHALSALYYDEYVKEKGEWKTKSSRSVRIYEESYDRRDISSLKLIADMFASSKEPGSR